MWRGIIVLVPLAILEMLHVIGWALREVSRKPSKAMFDWCYRPPDTNAP